jgi:hypothetical protein
MYKYTVITNRDDDDKIDEMPLTNLNEVAEFFIPINPCYIWLEESINNISYKLLKAFITNIVPFGAAGRKYFERIIKQRVGFTNEFIEIYNKAEKMYIEGTLKVVSYVQLQHLGYTGVFLAGKCPVDIIINHFKQQEE